MDFLERWLSISDDSEVHFSFIYRFLCVQGIASNIAKGKERHGSPLVRAWPESEASHVVHIPLAGNQ